jgi:hypothetical protein
MRPPFRRRRSPDESNLDLELPFVVFIVIFLQSVDHSVNILSTTERLAPVQFRLCFA